VYIFIIFKGLNQIFIIFYSLYPRELARLKELLEKPVRLKPGWPDNEEMAT
ncbi:hypothetical protein Gotur_029099, partial [Gossypium turneri]